METGHRRINPANIFNGQMPPPPSQQMPIQDSVAEIETSLCAEVRLSDAAYYPITIHEFNPLAKTFYVSFEKKLFLIFFYLYVFLMRNFSWQLPDNVPMSSVRLNPGKLYQSELRSPLLPATTLCQGLFN